MLWLIIARGLAGVGGGGIVNSVWTITTEIVPPRTKAKWSQALSVTWSASAVAGPILGGVFSGGQVSLWQASQVTALLTSHRPLTQAKWPPAFPGAGLVSIRPASRLV